MPSWMCRRCQRLFDERTADGRCALDGGELVELAAPQVEDEHTGRVYDEKYRVGRVIGRGGMGCVHEATNLRLEQPVAIKFFSPLSGATSGLTPGGGQERFRREAVTTVRLRHANVVEVLDYAIDPDGTQYIVMERLEGSPLDEALVRGGLTVGRALEILDLALKAVEYAHGQGVIHRDLKPGNVFLARLAGRETVKVLDFGIARVAELATITSGPVGTLRFAAPEQISGGRVTPAADVFSAGMLLHDMLAGGLPPAVRLGPDVPAGLRGIVERATSPEPSARFPDGGAMRTALAEAAAGLSAAEREQKLPRPVGGDGPAPEEAASGTDGAAASTPPPPPGPTARTADGGVPPPAEGRSPTAAILVIAVLVAAAALFFWMSRARPRAPVQQDGAVAANAEDARPADERTSSATPVPVLPDVGADPTVEPAPATGAPAPVLEEPADGSEVRSYPVPLRWSVADAAAGAGCEIEVAPVIDGTAGEPKRLRTPLTYASWPWDETAPAPGLYRWRARTGGEPAGAWSAPRTFRYVASALERIRSTGILRVGREVTYHRPFVYLDPESGEVVGFDVDLAREVARRLGAEARFVELDWNTELFRSLDDDRTDVVVSAVSITDPRRQKWSFSRPYLRTSQRYTVRADAAETFGPGGASFVAGAQGGTSSAEVAVKLLGQERVRLYDSVDLGVAALAAGEIDALVVDETLSPARRDGRFRLAGEPLSEEGYGVMARRGEDALLAAVDDILAELDRSGWLAEQLRRYELPEPRAETQGP